MKPTNNLSVLSVLSVFFVNAGNYFGDKAADFEENLQITKRLNQLRELDRRLNDEQWKHRGHFGFLFFKWRDLPNGIRRLKNATSRLPSSTRRQLQREQVNMIFETCLQILMDKINPYQGLGRREDETSRFYNKWFKKLCPEDLLAQLNHGNGVAS